MPRDLLALTEKLGIFGNLLAYNAYAAYDACLTGLPNDNQKELRSYLRNPAIGDLVMVVDTLNKEEVVIGWLRADDHIHRFDGTIERWHNCTIIRILTEKFVYTGKVDRT